MQECYVQLPSEEISMKKIYLIRHCKATGQEPDSQLTAEGIAQSNQLSRFLDNKPIDYIVSSPYLRAVDTINPFAKNKNLTIHIEGRLSERVLSSENLSDWISLLSESYDDLDKKLPGGESSREAMQRGVSVIQEQLNSSYQSIVVVTHGNLLSLIIKHYDKQFGFEEWKRLSNPDIYTMTILESGIELNRIWESFDEVGNGT